jgi:predicted outer membrane repeat protein
MLRHDFDFCTQAALRGGALYYNNSNPLIFASQFVSNEAVDGAGVVRTSTESPRLVARARPPALRSRDSIAETCEWLQLAVGTYAHLSVALIVRSVLSSNAADAYGGALLVQDGAKFIITDTIFAENVADAGGALSSSGSAGLNVSVYASRCVFANNSLPLSSPSRKGGAVLHRGSSAVIVAVTDFAQYDWADLVECGVIRTHGILCLMLQAAYDQCEFRANDATYGGAIYLSAASMLDRLAISIRDSTLVYVRSLQTLFPSYVRHVTNVTSTPVRDLVACSGNFARKQGGALYMLAAKLSVASTIFENNKVGAAKHDLFTAITLTAIVCYCQASESAGGVYSSESVMSLSGSRFVGNQASINAGGIYFDAGLTGVYSSSNDVFQANSARVGNGGAFYVESLSLKSVKLQASFTNTSFIENLSKFAKGGAIFGITSKLLLDKCNFSRNSVRF